MPLHPYEVTPGQPFSVWFFIRNHTDSTTYYVRAKIYDVVTGEILATVPLSQASTNSRLFITTTQAPPDPTGYGRNIVAIATVYTDSGYTTRSDAYEEQEQYYLVKTTAPVLGAAGVDYRVVRDILQEELQKLPKPQELKLPDEPDLSFVDGLFGTLGAITREIGRIPKEGPPPFERLEKRLTELKAAIEKAPKPERQSLAPLALSLDRIADDLAATRSEVGRSNANLITSIEAAVNNFAAGLPALIEKVVADTMASKPLTANFPMPLSFGAQPSPSKPTPSSPPDMRHLTAV
jgi:hypothetical protein